MCVPGFWGRVFYILASHAGKHFNIQAAELLYEFNNPQKYATTLY